jgi:hypothetical protein
VVLPVVGAVVRPLAKTVIKTGMMAYDAAAEGMTRAADATTGAPAGNIFTEARAEVDAEQSARTSARPAGAGDAGKPGDRRRAASPA